MTEETDHCRIGSLENFVGKRLLFLADHCRIGSLEILSGQLPSAYARSLPHRQLRNMNPDDGINRMGSLPHRQLRNLHYEPIQNLK